MHEVPDAAIVEPSDAVVRVVRACICGSDLWAYRGVIQRVPGARLGHEFIGIVEEVGARVRSIRVGDFVVAPFQWSDQSCPACRDGIQTCCINGGTFGGPGTDGGQGEAVRVPQADGTLVTVSGDAAVAPELFPALLALSDVAATGLHGAVLSGASEGATVAVLGARAVLGAERVILVSSHEDRAELGRAFGATEVVSTRGEEGVAAVRELTDGLGVRHVVEAVGTPGSWEMCVGMARVGGTIGAVGVPHTAPQLALFPVLRKHLTVSLGIAPVRRYLPDLVARVVSGWTDPGRVFDLTLPLDEVADGYQAMLERRSIKTMLIP